MDREVKVTRLRSFEVNMLEVSTFLGGKKPNYLYTFNQRTEINFPLINIPSAQKCFPRS